MRKTFIAIAAASCLASSNAWAGKHHPMTEAEEENCLIIDTNEAGEIWCVKSSVGMSEKEINAFWTREAEKGVALNKKATEVSYINCKKGMENYQTLGEWIGPPSAEDCAAFAKRVIAIGQAMEDEGINELIEELMKAQ